MKCFASVDTFVESSDESLKIGRLVANFQFLEALISFGTFDQYHLFCPALENQRLLKDRLEAVLPADLLGRVVLAHHFNLPHALKTVEYEVMHLGDWHCYIPHLAYLRERYACETFPITGPIHSLHGHDEARKAADLLRAPIRPWDAIICTSQAGRQVFRNILGLAKSRQGVAQNAIEPRLEVLPLGVPEKAFHRLDRSECRQKLNWPEKALHFLYIGRVSISSKGDLIPLLHTFGMLLEQIKASPEEMPRLVIAGAAAKAEIENLKACAQQLGILNHVEFRPDIEDQEKQALLCASDIFVSPVDNLQETFGISIVEAMAAGLPVLATDFDGYRDLVVEGETGYLIPTLWQQPSEMIRELRGILEQKVVGLLLAQTFALDMDVLLLRMKELVSSEALRLKLGEAGRRRAMAEFTWHRIIPRMEALWTELKAEGLKRAKESFPPSLPQSASGIFESFGHYPSRILKDQDELTLTPLANGVLNGTWPMPGVYEDLEILIPMEMLGAVVDSLREGGCAWGALRPALAQEFGFPEELMDYQALWLAKHGLVKIQERA